MKYNVAILDLEMPDRIKRLPISDTGYPVPWFVASINGVPDFRVVASDRISVALRLKVCWTCGEPLGRTVASVIGPMCAITRTISEPPSHVSCATFAATACPFLNNPRMRRNAKDLPEDKIDAPGGPIMRNPGAVAVWVTRGVRPYQASTGNKGVLFNVGDPLEVYWFANGRHATRGEVEESIATGFPLLREAATIDGPEAVRELQRMTQEAMRYLPPAGERA